MAEKNISKITLGGVAYDVKDSTAREGLKNIPTKVSQLQNDSGYLTEHQTIPVATDSVKGIVQTSSNYSTPGADTSVVTVGFYQAGATETNTAISNINTELAKKVKSLTPKDGSLSITGSTELSAKVNISATANNQLKLNTDGLYVAKQEQTDYTVICDDTTVSGYAKSYKLSQNGKEITTINIPKDMVVSSGVVETNPTGQPAGTYLVLTLANATEDKVYINVGSLIEYVTSGSTTADSVQIAISDDHKVTATIKDGSVSKSKLDSSVQASLNKADNSLATNGNASATTVTFTQAASRTNLTTGDTLAVLIGKIKKWFADLKTVAFTGSYNDLSDTPTIPTTTSELTNNSGFLTANTAPVKSVDGSTGAVVTNAVKYNAAQSLTTAQQAQARTNIGAGTSSFSGAYSDLTGRPTIPSTAEEVGALPITGGTLTGNLTGQYITGTWLQGTTANHLSSAATKIAVQDASGWIYHRTPAEIKSDIGAGNCNRVVASNVSISSSSWASSTTYSDYPYRASVSVTGMTTSHIPEVVFSMTDATSGNFGPVCESYSGGVYIYAKEQPTATTVIPVIEGRTTA